MRATCCSLLLLFFFPPPRQVSQGVKINGDDEADAGFDHEAFQNGALGVVAAVGAQGIATVAGQVVVEREGIEYGVILFYP